MANLTACALPGRQSDRGLLLFGAPVALADGRGSYPAMHSINNAHVIDSRHQARLAREAYDWVGNLLCARVQRLHTRQCKALGSRLRHVR